MPERQKAPRGSNPALATARQKVGALWTEQEFAEWVAPDPETVPVDQGFAHAIFDDGIARANEQARAHFGTQYDRKIVRQEERESRRHVEARTSAQSAAAGLTEEAKAEQAGQLKANAEATVKQWTPEEREALKDAIIEAEVSEAPAGTFDYDEPEDEPEIDYTPAEEGNAFFDPRAESIRASQLEAEAERLQLEDEANGLNAPGFSGEENEAGDES